jgi:hypothetical protein
MNNLLIITLTCLLTSIDPNSGKQQSAQLTINATQFKTSTGNAVVNLFREEDDLPEKPFKIVKSRIVTEDRVLYLMISRMAAMPQSFITMRTQMTNSTTGLAFRMNPWGFPTSGSSH